jgi:GT2 family glycosyltransferase
MTSPIAIILINWNNSQDTIECLASIFQSTYNRYTIIIVDNGSTDGSALEIANFVKQQMQLASRNIQQFSSVKKLADSSDDFHRWDENSTGARVLLLENKENLGFARANNLVMGTID